MIKHICATVYIIDQGKILLIHHRKLNKWVPPGGHIDENELPSDAAIREALEETGYEIELISDENIWIERWNATSIPRPYICLLENVPTFKDTPAHQHIDFIYLGRVVGGNPLVSEREVASMRWFSLEEIEALQSDIEIFEESKQSIRKILTDDLSQYKVSSPQQGNKTYA